MFDADTYFREYKAFIEGPAKQVASRIMRDFDVDKNGSLSRDQAQAFMQTTLGTAFVQTEFNQAFTTLDKGAKGNISASDLISFLSSS